MGGALGFTGALFGLGGGIITIPLLGIFFGYSQQLAQGTALLLIIPTATTALVQYVRRVRIDWKIAVVMLVTALPAPALSRTSPRGCPAPACGTPSSFFSW